MRTFPISFFRGLFDLKPLVRDVAWETLSGRLTDHQVVARKEDGYGWGPYRAVAPAGGVCGRHAKGPVSGPHRCDACVEGIELAVFDVDVGTWAEVDACDELLEAAGLHRCWYSSHSYRPEQERPSLRLVVPLEKPVPANRWRSWRRAFARRYKVPADLNKCGGLSHYYYLPAHPKGIVPVGDVAGSRFLDPDELPSVVELSPREVSEHDAEWERPEAPSGPVDLAPRWAIVAKYVASHGRKRNEDERRKAGWLRALSKGEPLADHGARNESSARTAAVLAFLLPDDPPEVHAAMMRPSVDAMIAQGSSLTHAEVERMVVSGLRKAHAAKAQDAAIQAVLDRRTIS